MLSYDVNNTMITDNRVFALYASAPGAVSAGGTISNLIFQGKRYLLIDMINFPLFFVYLAFIFNI